MFVCLLVFFFKATFLLLYGKLFFLRVNLPSTQLIFEVKHFGLGEESSSFNEAILGEMEFIYCIYFGEDGNYS